ncbi:hypothetical protein [Spiroplasma tabanidicola]|uniref:hypothetical protein n=1 Tax=Spiroplasma tabanidicola TaxID=324079 RepID=UPI0012DDBB25|nr:hypothetical protein [Spiroplasma tabanidicola]
MQQNYNITKIFSFYKFSLLSLIIKELPTINTIAEIVFGSQNIQVNKKKDTIITWIEKTSASIDPIYPRDNLLQIKIMQVKAITQINKMTT